MMWRKTALRKGFLVMLSLLAACYEDPYDVTLHEAHVYKGGEDVHHAAAAWQNDQLRKRFREVQTDR